MSLFDAFDAESREVVILSQSIARANGSSEVTSECMMRAMIAAGGPVSDLLQAAGLHAHESPAADGDTLPFASEVRSILERSLREALQSGVPRVSVAHLALSLLHRPPSFMLEMGVTALDSLRRDIAALTRISDSHHPDRDMSLVGATRAPLGPRRTDQGGLLERFGYDLTAAAAEGRLRPVLGRTEEIGRCARTLARQVKSNPLLVGDPGVGKTAVVEGLALAIARGEAPDFLSRARIVQLDLSSMLAGTRYRGDFEERLRAVMEAARRDPDLVLFIDEMHMLVGVGAAEGAVDGASMLKPALARGELRVIGATTFEGYRKHIARDAALERRFQVIEVPEPSLAAAAEMLSGLVPLLEKHHGVRFEEEVASYAVRMSSRFLPDRRLPDKAFDLVDEAAARVRSTSGVDPSRRTVSVDDVAETLSEWAGVPVSRVTADESSRLMGMEAELSKSVIGQHDAVSAVSRAVRRARAGAKDPRRPSGSFLFAGPSGVGKTELAKSLARFLFGSETNLLRFDMSEYQEKHTVSRLIGSPPGYIGHDEGGQLTEAVRRNPYSVVLLDEVEKAHPDVFNLLLQVLEEGSLTDGQGRKVDFQHTIVVLTSNLGTEEMASLEVGFSSSGSSEVIMRSRAEKEMDRFFRPELRNRIDETVFFSPLSADAVRSIASMLLSSLADRMSSQGVDIEFSDSFIDLIASEGYDPVMGARPARRAVQRHVQDRLADLMIAGEMAEGAPVRFEVLDGEPVAFQPNVKTLAG